MSSTPSTSAAAAASTSSTAAVTVSPTVTATVMPTVTATATATATVPVTVTTTPTIPSAEVKGGAATVPSTVGGATSSRAAAAAVGTRMPTFYVTHGGGPSFFMDGGTNPLFSAMDKNSAFCAWFKNMPTRLGTPTPKAILLVSAHWETTAEIKVTSQLQHNKLYFDYGGFPDHTYELQYNAPGNVALSKRVTELIAASGLKASEDTTRNFDHGVFVPLILMYPEAKIPVVEMSIFSDLDPAKHLKLGAALSPLRDEGVLIVGSGSSTHWFPRGRSDAKDIEQLAAWSSSLNALLEGPAIDRRNGLAKWSALPGADLAHGRKSMTGRADHLLPLMVAVGAAGDAVGERVGNFVAAGMNLDSWRFT